jgi:hypothetical protein
MPCAIRARSGASWLLFALVAASGCGDKRSDAKKAPTAGSATAQQKRPSPKAAAMETVLLWDASVQKMQEEVAKAEAEGDAAKAEDFRKKLEISRMGLDQAKRKLKQLEAVEAQQRQSGTSPASRL